MLAAVGITVSKFAGKEFPQAQIQNCLCCQADITEI